MENKDESKVSNTTTHRI